MPIPVHLPEYREQEPEQEQQQGKQCEAEFGKLGQGGRSYKAFNKARHRKYGDGSAHKLDGGFSFEDEAVPAGIQAGIDEGVTDAQACCPTDEDCKKLKDSMGEDQGPEPEAEAFGHGQGSQSSQDKTVIYKYDGSADPQGYAQGKSIEAHAYIVGQYKAGFDGTIPVGGRVVPEIDVVQNGLGQKGGGIFRGDERIDEA